MGEQTQTGKSEPVLYDAKTLLGDLRDRMLQEFRRRDKPWSELPEKEQRRLNSDVEQIARECVRNAIKITHGRGHQTLPVTVGDINTKGDFVISKLTALRSRDNIIALAEAGSCTLVMLDHDQFMGERAPAEVMKDQPDLTEAKPSETEEERTLRENGERIQAGIKPLEDGSPGETEPSGVDMLRDAALGQTPEAAEVGGNASPKTKRSRRTVGERETERGVEVETATAD